MSTSSDNDSQERFALGFLFALITLVVASVVGTVVYQRGIAGTATDTKLSTAYNASMPSPTEPAALAPSAIIVNEQAVVRVDDGVVKFFFATGKATLANGANEALATIVDGAATGKRVQVSGYHDAIGDVAVNAELAKKRALAVQAALRALGVAQAQIELSKPAQTLANGSNAEARRVEVILID